VHLSYQHKSIIVGGRIRSCFQAIGTSMYESNYIVCFKCFLIIGVRYISYGSFQTKFYKLVAVIVYARLEMKKLIICENSVSLISLRSRYILYGDGGLIIPPMRRRQPPQPCRHWCFGCRFCRYRYWLVHLAYEMLWLEHIATVISHGLMGSPHCGYFIYGSCPTWHMYLLSL